MRRRSTSPRSSGERFDAVLFADVLEHLRDPAALLRRVRPFVAEGGVVVASIPNIAHISVGLRCSAASSDTELGLLDDTHLRFFTREHRRPVRIVRIRHLDMAPPPHRPRRCGDPPTARRLRRGSPPSPRRSGGHDLPVRRVGVPSDAASQLADVRSKLHARTLRSSRSSSCSAKPTKRRRATSWPSGSRSLTRSPSSTT